MLNNLIMRIISGTSLSTHVQQFILLQITYFLIFNTIFILKQLIFSTNIYICITCIKINMCNKYSFVNINIFILERPVLVLFLKCY